MGKKNRFLLILFMLIALLAVPVQAKAAFKITKSGVTTPTTIKKGGTFTMKGTITGNQILKKVVCTIYDSTGNKCLQRYEATPNSKTYNLTAADSYLKFESLSVGTYYYRVCVYNSNNVKRRVANKKFKVLGTGKIKIVNPVPSSDKTITVGSSMSIGGKITSTYKLGSVTAKILNSAGKTVYSKTVKPNAKTYTVSSNGTLDAAMLFNKLSAGTYTFRLSAVDSEGQNVVLIQRTITVKASSSTTTSGTSTNSTGSTTTTSSSTYLNYTGTVSTPSGFVARTVRPLASNVYYYNSSYNIYYKYNSLAPTGKVYYGSQYVIGNCTWYACGRAMEIVAKAGGNIADVQAIFGGDPVGIYQMNVTKKKFSYGTTPKVGSLAIFNYGSSGDAHIAVVEKIIDGVPYVSESGYSVSSTAPNSAKSNIVFKYQSIYNWAGGRSLLGYIYLLD